MDMRLPGSGSWLESVVSSLGTTTIDSAGDTTVAGATEAQVNQALDAMERGDIEYVILEDGDRFLQAAGESAGPYSVQYSPGASDDMIEVPGGVDVKTMRDVLLAYRRGDDRWRTACTWSRM